MLDASILDNVFALHHCLPYDRVFHGRGTSCVDFFYMYYRVVRDLCIQFPLGEFSMRVLNVLNVAPSQLHPNS